MQLALKISKIFMKIFRKFTLCRPVTLTITKN